MCFRVQSSECGASSCCTPAGLIVQGGTCLSVGCYRMAHPCKKLVLQVSLAQWLGYANVFDPVRPSMHYRLRMWRADEHQVGAVELQKGCLPH